MRVKISINSILGWAVSLIGLFSSFYFYFESIKEKTPTFIVDPIKTTLIDTDLLKDKPINILDASGKEILGNVTVITFYFFNQGDQSIKKEDILDPLKLKITNGAKILDYRILKISRPVTELVFGRYDSIQGSIEFDFRILELDDGFTGQLICSSNADVNVEIEGVIEGVKEFSNTYKSRNNLMIEIVPGALMLALFVLIQLVTLYWVNVKGGGKGNGEQKTLLERLTTRYQLVIRNEENLGEKSTIGFTYARILVISVSIFMVIFISSLFLSRTLFKVWFEPIHKNKVEVPAKILP